VTADRRLTTAAQQAIKAALRSRPLLGEIAALAGSFDGTMHGDTADRIIVATACVLGARIVTADERLRGLKDVVTVW
jgi:PIN domain nuclease of toxin-antitoxin system